MEENQKKTVNTARLVREKMSDGDFELYLYSLKKLAENNYENNLTFMTNLYNIRAFQVKAQEEMLENPDMKFAIIVLDFANFNTINEFCGRDVGDGLLKCVADALRCEAEGKDHTVLAHFRADVFAVFTPFEDKSELIEIVNHTDKRIAAYKIPYKVLPAFGICIADSPTMAVSTMRDYAMLALNTIKGKFYAKYAFFDDEMRKQMLLNKMVENDIIKALEEEQLLPFIQPKVDMKSGEIVGGEALVRWHHPEKGIVMPMKFIPVLEKNGLIIDVDICIWRQIFKFIGNRIAAGEKVVPISINISRQHVFDSVFRDCIIDFSKEFHVPPELVVLELTESGFLEDNEKMYDHLRYLKVQGFALSMDDFGTGYSTMTMLKNQPMDEIKIDRGFIVDIENPKSQSILSHTINMLQDLDLNIIVEGVENAAQQEYLLKYGCNKAQGFLYYKPMPMEEFATLLDKA